MNNVVNMFWNSDENSIRNEKSDPLVPVGARIWKRAAVLLRCKSSKINETLFLNRSIRLSTQSQ